MVADRTSAAAGNPTADDVVAALQAVDDPEMPVSIVELGLISAIRILPTAIEVDLTPTFIGCPALALIRDRAEAALRPIAPGIAVQINWVMSPRWTVDRISDAGRHRLRAFGVTTPDRRCSGPAAAHSATTNMVPLTVGGELAAVSCPYCRSAKTHIESPFGPTRCRMIYYCDLCRNSFEHLKPI